MFYKGWLRKGKALCELQDLQGSLDAIQQGISLEPTSPELLNAMETILNALEKKKCRGTAYAKEMSTLAQHLRRHDLPLSRPLDERTSKAATEPKAAAEAKAKADAEAEAAAEKAAPEKGAAKKTEGYAAAAKFAEEIEVCVCVLCLQVLAWRVVSVCLCVCEREREREREHLCLCVCNFLCMHASIHK
jgi:hypothetical protein